MMVHSHAMNIAVQGLENKNAPYTAVSFVKNMIGFRVSTLVYDHKVYLLCFKNWYTEIFTSLLKIFPLKAKVFVPEKCF